MAHHVLMPKMGYDMTSGKILRWIKQEGDPVIKGEAIAEIQTEKVNIEIEAFETGVLAKILHGADADVPVGEPIAIIAAPGERVQAPEPVAPPAPRARVEPLAAPVVAEAAPRVKASPLARKLAADRGIPLEQVHGSGPGGRIVRRDVEASPGAPAPSLPAAPRPVAAVVGDRRLPLSRMRQGIARRLSESMATSPHFYLTKAIDMTEAVAFRSRLNAALPADVQVSFNDMLVRAVGLAAASQPQVNASWDGDALQQHGAVHVGIAVALPEGLVVPVLRDAGTLRLPELAIATRDLIGRARGQKLRPEELSGGTITISNLGAYDVESFTAILNPPEAAILAIGTIRREPVVTDDDQVVVRSLMRITMSSDHRVIDGAGAALFLGEVKRLLESPMLLLL